MIERKILIFRMAAELGNFTEAAAALNMTQPNVTRQISLLEQQLGTALFERDGRKVILTPAGKTLLEETGRLVSASDLIAGKVRSVAHGMKQFRVGATLTAGGYVLPGILAAFMRSHPDHRLDLDVANTVEIADMLQKHLLDMALIEGPFDGNCFFSSLLLKDELKVVGHPELLEQPFSIADYLKNGGRFILREAGSGTRHYFYEYLRNNNLPQPLEKNIVEANNFETIKGMVREKFGITVISELAVCDELTAGYLSACTAIEGPVKREMNFIYMPSGKLKFIEQFIAFAKSHIKKS